jgi:multidrug efflux system outer membrane protein
MGPDYVRPQVDAPAAFRFEAAATAAAADTAWWGLYDDPVLDQLVAEALANNHDVRIAAASVRSSEGVLAQVRSALWPQLGYSASAGRNRVSGSGGTVVASLASNPVDTYQAAFTASWEIDLWGRTRRLAEAAGASVAAADEARRGVVLALVATLASSYLELRGLDEQLVIARRTQGAYGESLRVFTLQHDHGQVSQMTVAQARSRFETASAQVPLIEQRIAQLEDAMCLLLARDPGPIPRGKPLGAMSTPPVPAGLPSGLLERRPDLRQAELELVAANAQIGAAKALYFPTISLTGAYGAESTELAGLFKGPARTWSYAGSLLGPIFTAGAVAGQVAQAEAGRDAALEGYRRSIQNAFADVSNALIARQKLLEQEAVQERLVAALAEYANLARLQYDGGYAPYSTVLQAQQELFPAELNLAATRAASAAAVADIYKAMGGGWVARADAQTLKAPAAR